LAAPTISIYIHNHTANCKKYLQLATQNDNTYYNMALRRPPTRIELKADDVEEYDKVR